MFGQSFNLEHVTQIYEFDLAAARASIASVSLVAGVASA
jgi:hypothetical protein